MSCNILQSKNNNLKINVKEKVVVVHHGRCTCNNKVNYHFSHNVFT